jgi:hypothetical protein
LYSARNRTEKLAIGSIVYLFLNVVQINLSTYHVYFADNVHILYLSWNVKNHEITAKLLKLRCSNRFWYVSSVKYALILLPLLTIAQHESATRKLFLTKKISHFLFLAVEDILVLYPPHTGQEKIHALFPRKNLFIYLFITVQTLFSLIKPRFYYC